MNALAFLRSETVMALLERAVRGAGVPASLHYVKRNQEGARIYGWGQCGACAHVHALEGGGMACRLSRTASSTQALRQQRAIPFVCHMGFACVSVPLLPDEGYVLTLGPYCPMEEQRSLAEDIREGLAALLGTEVGDFPVALDDIHRAPADAVPAIAGWMRDAVQAAWAAAQALPEAGSPSLETEPEARSVPERPDRAPARLEDGTAREIAAALAAGSRKQARALFLRALEEMRNAGVKQADARRAAVVALAGATLEHVSRAGVAVEEAWQALPRLADALSSAETERQMADAAMAVFGFLRGGAARASIDTRLPHYPELFALVRDRLLEGITLEEVAAELGQTPSAITHRLQRKFGMSFSDYMARLRVNQAKTLLRRTRLSASEVARRVGVRDPSNFARLFRKVEGISPTAYRERFGKK
jgi:AraC-like DNA-binding protein